MKYEPFDLERALAGEPVALLNNNPPLKVYLSKSKLRNDGIIVEYLNDERKVARHGMQWISSHGKNIAMWQEPRPRVKLDLPAPLKEPHKDMWLLGDGCVIKSNYSVSNHDEWMEINGDVLRYGKYFATKEDAQEWLEAMKEARR